MKNARILLGFQELYPLPRRFLYILPAVLFLAAGCRQPLEAPGTAAAERQDGLVTVHIPLTDTASRESVWISQTPQRHYVVYYEAVMREIGTNNYFVGSAVEGESILTVSVTPEKRYEAIILAGVTVAGTGEKVLLASGYENNNGQGVFIERGRRNVITVRMSIHKTIVNFYEGSPPSANPQEVPSAADAPSALAKRRPLYLREDTANRRTVVEAWEHESNLDFHHDLIYHAQISGANALYRALGMTPTNPAAYINAHNAQIAHYTEPNAVTPVSLFDSPLPALGFRENIIDYDTGTFKEIIEVYAGINHSALPGLIYKDYVVAFDMTYYAYGDSRSRSSLWHLRRGFTHDLKQPAGGAILLRFVDPKEYYVKADGDDSSNDGLEPGTPFKTIAHALSEMKKPGNDIRTIVVIGTLNNASEGGGTERVFDIVDMPAGMGEIMITGYVEGGGGTLSGAGVFDRRVLGVSGPNTKVRLDHITITGNNTNADTTGGIIVGNKARLILTDGAIVTGNRNSNGDSAHLDKTGAGVLVKNADLTIYGGEISYNNKTQRQGNGYGGGLAVIDQGTVTMYGGTIKNNEAKRGGGVYVYSGSFTMFGGFIENNIVAHPDGWNSGLTITGAGVLVGGAESIYSGDGIFRMYGGTIRGNTQKSSNNSGRGGGGMCVDGDGTFEMHNGLIEGNTARFGGGVLVRNGLFRMTGGIIRNNTITNTQGNSIYRYGGGGRANHASD